MAGQSNIDKEQFFVATASQSQARAETVLPAQGSEDVSHLLGAFTGDEPSRPAFDEHKDHLPNSKVDWVARVEFPSTVVLRKPDIASIFNADWLKKHHLPTVFGFSPDIQRWTFVSAGGVPDNYSRLQIAWKMRPLGEDGPIAKQQFEQYMVAVEKAASKLKAIGVRTDLSPAEAEKRSAALIELAESCEQGIDVVLQAPKGRAFEGKLIWDVMLCLGLRWGDMDLFHWENPGIPGDDHLFSVWTTTPPGYFFPERIAAGQVQTADIAFGFSIARTVQPEAILESMMKAIHYAQKRMGGTLMNVDGIPFSEDVARSEIRTLVERLRSAGFEPGTDDTLYLI
jgi:cell division protein ZipA